MSDALFLEGVVAASEERFACGYCQKDWLSFFEGGVDEDARMKMTEHLAICDECMDVYVALCQAQQMYAPDLLSKQVMNVIAPKKKVKKKQIMLAYVAAACVALVVFSAGTASFIAKMPETMVQLEQQIKKTSFEREQSFKQKVKEKQQEQAEKEKENRKNQKSIFDWGEIFQ